MPAQVVAAQEEGCLLEFRHALPRRSFPGIRRVFGQWKLRQGEEGRQKGMGQVAAFQAPLSQIDLQAEPRGVGKGEEGIDGVVLQGKVGRAQGAGEGEHRGRFPGDGIRPEIGTEADRVARVGDLEGRRGHRILRRRIRVQAADHTRHGPLPRRRDNVRDRRLREVPLGR